MKSSRLLSHLFFVPICLSCGVEKSPPSQALKVPAGAFALLGGQALSLKLLDLRSDEDTVEAILSQELMAGESKRELPHRASAVERGVLGRRMLQYLEQESSSANPISAAELKEQRDKSWYKFDRPRAVRSAEVFLPVEKLTPGAAERTLADEIHRAVSGALNVEEFASLAQAVPAESPVVVRLAPPVSADGRVVSDSPEYSTLESLGAHFGEAVNELQSPGEISGVVASESGFHILFALEITQPHVISPADARQELEKAVLASRLVSPLEELTTNGQVVQVRSDLTSLLRPFWRVQ